jgi:hypothetical protein
MTGGYTMTMETKRIHITPGSELARLLEEAGEVPLLLEKDGELYRLSRAEDIWAGYDPDKARAALLKSAGALRGVNRDQLLTDIHQAREQDSRGRLA